MEALAGILIGTQLVFTVIAGLYFYTNLKAQSNSKNVIGTETKKELEKMRRLRQIKLSEPLSEKTRPANFDEIIGQTKGIRALKAALCGPNPQHVIIYGPPGVGKTAAARIILKDAAKRADSPFKENSPFVEIDATILQFDERSIADPLIGSVHDPIYQGAGIYGQAGVPQPKQGAVTKAHGGVLFIDEIGELHPVQMNKLLKVLEDRKVFLSSSYYSKEDTNIPKHIHDIFGNGLPADFRLIGATTRRPEDIPQALRSRCTEIFFKPLSGSDVAKIASNAMSKINYSFRDGVTSLICSYCSNGRDTVNLVQTASSVAHLNNRSFVTQEDVEEVIESGQYAKNLNKTIKPEKKTGVVNALAVFAGCGQVMEIEASAVRSREKGKGSLKVTGIINEEEISTGSGKLKRQGTAAMSAENAITLLSKYVRNIKDYDIHINFPGGAPIDGPSAGIAIFTAVFSSLTGLPVPTTVAMTGEISIKGKVNPVGAVAAKIEGAIEAGVSKIFVPADNFQNNYANYPADIIYVKNIKELLDKLIEDNPDDEAVLFGQKSMAGVLTAQSVKTL
ncbi:MAG: ATP-dependent protease LonB [Clostridiales bacterium]|jgi:Lon-like ATP-dependent protease|nr:ATP-dependent protease LonB [Clostridiales bacterium]